MDEPPPSASATQRSMPRAVLADGKWSCCISGPRLRPGSRGVVALPALQIDLPYRPPIAWDRLVAFIGARAARGVEYVVDGHYARTVRIGKYTGVIRVAPPARNDATGGIA